MLTGCSSTSTPGTSNTETKQPTTQGEQSKDVKAPDQPVQPNKPQSLQPESEAKAPVGLIKTTVTRVVDGDTIHARVNGKDEAIRLIGVDTPETVKPNTPVQPYGTEASSYTKAQLTGKTVWLEKDVQERDKYGRLLTYVWTEQPTQISDSEIRSKMFNARLMLDGYARLDTIPPDVKCADYFTQYQTEAREANKGLWGLSVTPTAPTTPKPSNLQDNKTISSNRKYVGNSNSHKFHYADCQWAEKISPSHIVNFNSRQDATNACYVPCKVCNP